MMGLPTSGGDRGGRGRHAATTPRYASDSFLLQSPSLPLLFYFLFFPTTLMFSASVFFSLILNMLETSVGKKIGEEGGFLSVSADIADLTDIFNVSAETLRYFGDFLPH